MSPARFSSVSRGFLTSGGVLVVSFAIARALPGSVFAQGGPPPGTMDHWDAALTDGFAEYREVILFNKRRRLQFQR
jgi:hypothetical protein